MFYEVIGDVETLELLSDGCVELAHASLKLASHLRDNNKVYNINEVYMIKNIIEKIVDVNIIYNEVLDTLEKRGVDVGVDVKNEFGHVYQQKMEMIKKRLSKVRKE